MAISRSTALINKLAQGYGVRELLRDMRIYEYSGSQPTSADVAPTGTLLNVYTFNGGVFTAPVRSAVKITLAGVAGSVDTIKVGGMAFNLLSAAVPFNTSLAQTALDVKANINARQNPLNIEADTSGADVLLYLPYWLGAGGDGLTVAVTLTTLTGQVNGGSSAAFGGTGSPAAGTTAVNGLNFLDAAVAGAVSKEAGVWSGAAVATGNAGWFRAVAGGSTVDGVGGTDVRFDGLIATDGGDMRSSGIARTAGALYTIPTGTIREPAA